MNESQVTLGNHAIRFNDDDVVNLDDFVPQGDYNPHNTRPFLLHDHGFTLCVVFADCLQDALDIAADEGKLEQFRIHEDELADYVNGNGEEEGIDHLGNHGEPFDIESVQVVELPNPAMSYVALYATEFEDA